MACPVSTLVSGSLGMYCGTGNCNVHNGICSEKRPVQKKIAWIVGGIGLLMVISSGTQLTASLF